MRSQRNASEPLEDAPVPVRTKLAGLWASVLFLYIYVDILSLYRPGVIDGILDGRVWEFDISQSWAVGALALMAVPIVMVVLSLILPARANRTANLVVATLYLAVSVSNVIGETWAYFFALAVVLEVAVLALVLRFAWTWPRMSPPTSTDQQPVERTHRLVEH
jgi:hypothetical protein